MEGRFAVIDTATVIQLMVQAVNMLLLGLFIALIILVFRALIKYTKSKDIRKGKAATRISLGEVLKENRTRCRMTQEFVAESLGVSRQAISKWENGTSDPSTSNLIACAKLYGIPAEDLLKEVGVHAQGRKENTKT